MRIDLQNITVRYGPSLPPVFQDLSLVIESGDMVYLVGPSGSGKSTLLRTLYMDLLPERGIAKVGDYSSESIARGEIPFLRRSLGIVFQDFKLLPDRSIYENVAFALYVTGGSGLAVRSRVGKALARVGLTHKARQLPHELSGGEQQRVVIARAIVNDPWILLADEPTGNLDPAVGEGILELLVELNGQGMTLLVATHDYRLIQAHPARTLAFGTEGIREVDPANLAK